MGVEFVVSNPAAIKALLGLCSESDSVRAPNPGTRADRSELILRQCSRESIGFVEPMMAEWFGAILTALQEAAQHATNDQQASDFKDAASRIQSRQRVFWRAMSQAMESPLRLSQHKRTETVQLDLVDKGDFEEWLLLRVMVTKAETQFRAPLLQLKMRLDAAGVALESGHQNPLGPILVCDAFRQALSQLDWPPRVDKLAFRVFENEVVRHLEKLYISLNGILIRQGILPDLDLSKYLTERNPVAERARKEERQFDREAVPVGQIAATQNPARAHAVSKPSTGGGKEAERKPVARASVRSSATLQRSLKDAHSAFTTVGHLLAQFKETRSVPGREHAVDPDAVPLSLPELQQQLGAIEPGHLAPEVGVISLRERVGERVQALEGRCLDPEQETLVDVVDQFFDSIQQSPRLSSLSRRQIQQLDMPVLRAVLQERRLLEEEQGPVRGVINRIAQLGLRGGRENPALLRKTADLVERVNQGFDKDADVFREALAELDVMIARQNLAYRRNVERVTAAAEGAQKVDAAKRAVAQALNHRLGGQQVPRALVSLLNGGWRDLLSLTYVRQGPDSSLWHKYLGVLDNLLAYSRDPEMTLDLPELLRVIQEGLAMVSSNRTPSGQVRDELKQFLTGDAQTAPLIGMPAIADGTRSDLHQLSGSRQRGLQRWMSRAQSLHLGEWMRFQEDPDNPSYMRLIWIGTDFSRFVFVNHQGMKVLELDRLRLAIHLQKGLIVSDPGFERPIVDESIGRMIQQVYEQASRASAYDELTGVRTRREFERVLGQWLATGAFAATRSDIEQKVLAVIELQRLREASDSAGIEVADDALRQIANLLRTLLPTQDAGLARVGRTRFAVLLEAATAEVEVAHVVDRIRAVCLTFKGRQYTLTATAGLAIEQAALATPERWLTAAEEVLVRNGREARGGLVWYTPDPQQLTEQARVTAKVTAIESIGAERVLLRRQRVIPLHAKTRGGIQHQLLFSVYDDKGQLIHSPEFIRMAEYHNRAQQVDRKMVGHMLDWATRNPKALERFGGISISLSGRSLGDTGLLEFIFDHMSREDVPIESLWFEVAEAAAIDSLDHSVGFMTEMRELGCRFCLGSFGGRRESYAMLKRLPVDRVKLDPSFMRDLQRSKADQAMVRSMTEMAHFLGREVVACEVDSIAVLDLLREMGVDYAQGHAIEKARPLES